ncbi:MAG: DUF3892 domain-containing protein [Candidatus Electrothrix sp. AR3]|nr:DUF3892 domain-containing protein [Candidatus Electrothrix sp. AR3]
MTHRLRIKYIKKTDRTEPHEKIEGIGGLTFVTDWYFTVDQAISKIESGIFEFCASVNGKSVDVIIATHNGHKYLKTKADGRHENSLLGLAEYPQQEQYTTL